MIDNQIEAYARQCVDAYVRSEEFRKRIEDMCFEPAEPVGEPQADDNMPKPIFTDRQKRILLKCGFALTDNGVYKLYNPPFRCSIRYSIYEIFECITSNCIYTDDTLYGIIAQLICRTEDFDRQTGMRLLANFVND